jgi:hypothetical protein
MVEAQVVGLMKMPVGFVNMCIQPEHTDVFRCPHYQGVPAGGWRQRDHLLWAFRRVLF